jgi:hypothetical protein
MKTDNLIKVSTYIKREGISATEAYRRIKSGKLSTKKIDGIIFISEKP